MKIEKIDLSQERQIITMMIVSTQFLDQIIPILNIRLLKSSYAKIVSKWVLDYYDEYKQAPGKNIQTIYQSKIKTLRNEEDTEIISDFLYNLSKDYENKSTIRNIDYIVKESINYLKLSSLELLKDEIEECIIKKDIIVAENKIATYNRIEKPINKSIRLLHDSESIAKAFTDQEETIFTFPGVLGKVCGPFLRGDLASFLAAQKRGKCIIGDSLIQLTDGSIDTIENIVNNKNKLDIISLNEVNLKFEKDKIEDFIYCGIHSVYEIELRTGRKISCAGTHPFLTFNGWKKLKELRVGDKISVVKNLNIFSNLNIPEYKIRLLAYLLAEGGLTGTSITFTKKEYNIMNDFIKCVYSIGDYITWGDDIHVSIRNKGHKSNKKTKTRLFLESIGIDRCKSINKEIPNCVFLLNEKLCSLFLNILFTCDGSIFSNKRGIPEIEYSSGSEKMIHQIQILLSRFNIISVIRKKKVKGVFYYVLCIKDKENIVNFFDRIGFSFSKEIKMKSYFEKLNKINNYGCVFSNFPIEIQNKIKPFSNKSSIVNRFFSRKSKNIKCKSIRRKTVEKLNKIIKSKELDKYLKADIFWDEIKSIKYKGKRKCYDLSIKKNHNYIANGIVSHNSWWQWTLSYMSMFCGLRVIFFSLEMTENQIKRRAWQSLVAQPRKDTEIEMPYFVKDNGKWNIEKKIEKRKGVDINEIKEKQKKFRVISRGGDIWIKVIPARSFSIDDIIIEIDNMKYYEGCVPDMVIIDYADILKPSRSVERKDIRHQLDYTWSTMRGLAQDRNILVVTASQTNRAGLKKDATEDLLAEDVRKIAHVSKMIAINKSKEDSLNNLVRIEQLAERDGRIDRRQVTVLECLSIGRPYLDSRYTDEVII